MKSTISAARPQGVLGVIKNREKVTPPLQFKSVIKFTGQVI